MKTIDIASDMTVNAESINFIMRRDDGTALVQVGDRILNSEIPFDVVKALMKTGEAPQPKQVNSPLLNREPVEVSETNPFKTDPAW